MTTRDSLPHVERIRDLVRSYIGRVEGFKVADLISDTADKNQISRAVREFEDMGLLFRAKVAGIRSYHYFGSRDQAAAYEKEKSEAYRKERKRIDKEAYANKMAREREARKLKVGTPTSTFNNFLFGNGVSPRDALRIVISESDGSDDGSKTTLARANEILKNPVGKQVYGRGREPGARSRSMVKVLPRTADIVYPEGLKIQVYRTSERGLELSELREVSQEDIRRAQEDIRRAHPELEIKDTSLAIGENDEEFQKREHGKIRYFDGEGE